MSIFSFFNRFISYTSYCLLSRSFNLLLAFSASFCNFIILALNWICWSSVYFLWTMAFIISVWIKSVLLVGLTPYISILNFSFWVSYKLPIFKNLLWSSFFVFSFVFWEKLLSTIVVFAYIEEDYCSSFRFPYFFSSYEA